MVAESLAQLELEFELRLNLYTRAQQSPKTWLVLGSGMSFGSRELFGFFFRAEPNSFDFFLIKRRRIELLRFSS